MHSLFSGLALSLSALAGASRLKRTTIIDAASAVVLVMALVAAATLPFI